MIYNYNIPVSDFVESTTIIDDISVPYFFNDDEAREIEVYYAFTGRALTNIEFTVDSNTDLDAHDVTVEVVSLVNMGGNYFAFHVRLPWFKYFPEESDNITMAFSGIVRTDNPYVTKSFRFTVKINGCEYVGLLLKGNLYFYTETGGAFAIQKLSSNQRLFYSYNPNRYNEWQELRQGEGVELPLNKECWISGILSGDNTSGDTGDYTQFSVSGDVSIHGNLNYIWDGEEEGFELKQYCGLNLFSGCTGITDVSDLVLCSEELPLSKGCFKSLFQGCTRIEHLPQIPSTDIAEECYMNMFCGCSSLKEVLVLPSEVIPNYAYYGMFRKCTALEEVPEQMIPASAVGSYGCAYMFSECTNLVNTPTLPATSITTYSYASMFYYCINLLSTPDILPATALNNYCYERMFSNCKKIQRGPELPAYNVNRAYNYMFAGCDSLIEIPKMNAPENKIYVGRDGAQGMFQGCISLERIPTELTVIGASSMGARFMFQGCTALTYFESLKLYTGGDSNNNASYLFDGCKNLENMPLAMFYDFAGGMTYAYAFRGCEKIPYTPWFNRYDAAGEKENLHFQEAFKNCKSLTEINGYLTITEFRNGGVYKDMFNGCENLRKLGAFFNEDPSDPNSILSKRGSLANWLYGVPTGDSASDSGCVFYQSWDAVWDSSIDRGPSSIPDGWKVVRALYYVATEDLSQNSLLQTVQLVDNNGNLYTGTVSSDYSEYSQEHEEGVLVYEVNIGEETKYDLKIKAFFGDLLKNNTTVKRFYIPDTVEVIQDDAFNGCSNIRRIEIGRGVKIIGARAFYGLSWVDFRQVKVTSSNDCEYYYMPLSSMTTIHDGLEEVRDYAFYNCSNFTGLSFTENSKLRVIGDYAFTNTKTNILEGTTKQDSHLLTIPSGVTSIGKYAFSGVTISYQDSCINYNEGETRPITKEEAFTITITGNTTTIGEHAFDSVRGVSYVHAYEYIPDWWWCRWRNEQVPQLSLVLGQNVTTIEAGAFSGMTQLGSVTINKVLGVHVDPTAFDGVPASGTVYYPGGAHTSSDYNNTAIGNWTWKIIS